MRKINGGEVQKSFVFGKLNIYIHVMNLRKSVLVGFQFWKIEN